MDSSELSRAPWGCLVARSKMRGRHGQTGSARDRHGQQTPCESTEHRFGRGGGRSGNAVLLALGRRHQCLHARQPRAADRRPTARASSPLGQAVGGVATRPKRPRRTRTSSRPPRWTATSGSATEAPELVTRLTSPYDRVRDHGTGGRCGSGVRLFVCVPRQQRPVHVLEVAHDERGCPRTATAG